MITAIITQLTTIILRLITLILRILVFPIAKGSRYIFPAREFDDVRKSGEKAARAFVTQFTSFLPPSIDNADNSSSSNSHNDHHNHNPLEAMSYSNAISTAHHSNKFVLLFLHSPLHPDSKHFIRHGLADPRVLNFLNTRRAEGNLMVWGGSVHTADGAAVARALNVCAYPFIALLSCQRGNGNSADVLLRLEGLQPRYQAGNNTRSGTRRATIAIQIPFQPTDFLSIIAAHLLSYQNILDEALAQARRREEEAALRAEQDREFQEALEADRRRDAERAEAERQEQLRIQEEEKRVRLEAEARMNALDEAKRLVSEEPPSGAGVARLRLFLPSGSKVDRRFYAHEKVEVIRAYVKLYFHDNDISINNFELSSNYPKRILDNDQDSIQEVLGGLQAVIMVRDLDS